MATITIYAGKVNALPGLIKDLKSSVSDLKSDLSTLKKKVQAVDSAVCNLDDVISSITAAAQTEERRVDTLASFAEKCKDFIDDVVRADEAVADAVDEGKDDFYSRYYYLKPNSEKSGWEKFCDGVGKVCDWCKDHWKLIVTAVIVIVAVVLICTGIGGILGAMALGALIGAGTGGLMGGLSSLAAGGSFWEGFENGAFSGAIMGMVTGAITGFGTVLGSSCKFAATALGSFLTKIVPAVSKIAITLSSLMGGFDLLSWAAGLFDPNNLLTQFNARVHSSALYNTFQITVSAIAAFTGGFNKGMQQRTCFVAGTMILTASGLVAIENIKVGDKVISTDPNTGITEEKAVLETFRRTATEFVHLTIRGEQIITTHDHPFYVIGKGFVNAGKLKTSDKLLDTHGKPLEINDIAFESTGLPTKVFNFKVEKYHTYYASNICIFVHNSDCAPRRPVKDVKKVEEHPDGSVTYTKSINGKDVSVTYSKEGYPDFSPYTHPEYSEPVQIEYTGNRTNDYSAANKALGLKKTPPGYTWHHLEDGKSMILVDKVIHGTKFGFPHTGGFSINQI